MSNDLIFFDKSDGPGNFSGNYVIKNLDSSSTAVAFNIISPIIDIDWNNKSAALIWGLMAKICSAIAGQIFVVNIIICLII